MTRLILVPLLVLSVAFLFAGCGDKPGGGGEEHADGHEDHDEGPHGGVIAELGEHEAHFEMIIDHGKRAVIAHVLSLKNEAVRIKDAPILNLKFSDESKQLTGQAVDMTADGASEWHFRDDLLAGEPESGRFRIQWNGKPYQIDLAHAHDDHEGHEHGDDDGHDHDDDDGHDHDDDDGHEHDDDDGHEHDVDYDRGTHAGVMAPFLDAAGKEIGMVELKLHDDKGDLELWIMVGGKPFDVSCDTEITLSFHEVEEMDDKGGMALTLAVRNKEKNEDEDGTANMRTGNVTNYFIFPGETGADAAWLTGEGFEADVTLSFTSNGTAYTTKEFELVPHTHSGDHDHDHDK